LCTRNVSTVRTIAAASHLLGNAEETKISLQILQLVMKHGCTVVTHNTKQPTSQWKTLSPLLPQDKGDTYFLKLSVKTDCAP
jgi:hypothetical protein